MFYTFEKFEVEMKVDLVESTIEPILKEGGLYNCWEFVRDTYYADMPSTAIIKANMVQEYSDIAVFYYKKSDLWHYAKTTGSTTDSFTVDEANYKAGQRTQRTISFVDPNFMGFYKQI